MDLVFRFEEQKKCVQWLFLLLVLGLGCLWPKKLENAHK